MKVLVTTHPFGDPNDLPRRLLEDYEVIYNDTGRKLKRAELLDRLNEFSPDIIIAGTENYDNALLDLVPNLKLISRVGIGLDSVPVQECRQRGIEVAYTPDAPSNAVAELTIGQMLNCLRKLNHISNDLKGRGWNRYIGREIRDCDIGIFGCGRIGTMVVEKLSGLKPRRIFVNDIDVEKSKGLPRSEPETKMQILSSCDIVSLHIPYNKSNEYFIGKNEFRLLKKDAILINTSRGGLVDERELFEWLDRNPMAMSVLDVFEEEPYKGPLCDLSNVYLTPHLGSCSTRSRFNMEMGAVEAVMNYVSGSPVGNLAPNNEGIA